MDQQELEAATVTLIELIDKSPGETFEVKSDASNVDLLRAALRRAYDHLGLTPMIMVNDQHNMIFYGRPVA